MNKDMKEKKKKKQVEANVKKGLADTKTVLLKVYDHCG